MNRWDIINSFIQKHNYKSYLEIGYYKGWSFDQVKCEDKTATDPNPCKNEFQQSMPPNSILVSDGGCDIHKCTSDYFFSKIDEDEKWDIIFIDGLHEATQVSRDIENALKHLSPGGTIVLHDCNPPTLQHSTIGDKHGNWNGDVYKAFIKARIELPYLTYTIDTDWGVGVIHPNIPARPLNFPVEEIDYEALDNDRYEILNLISVEDFKTKMNEEIKNNNLPA